MFLEVFILFISRPEVCNFIKKENLAQMYSCEFCEISKNTFFIEHLWVTASGPCRSHQPIGYHLTEAVSRVVLQKKMFLEISRNPLCQILVLITFRPQVCNFIKKETLAQLFSCESCEISKNTCFTEHLWATASDLRVEHDAFCHKVLL